MNETIARYQNIATISYRSKTVYTVLAALRLRLEPLVSIEVTAFFKRWTYRRCLRSIIRSNYHWTALYGHGLIFL